MSDTDGIPVDTEDRSEPESPLADVEVPTAPHLILELEGDRQLFRARGQKANQYLLVKYVDDLGVPGLSSTRAVIKLALGQVAIDEQPRLEAYLDAHGYADDFENGLFAALDACWKGETMLPFGSPSVS